MTLWPDATSIPGISDHQREQLSAALRSPVAILTGGPGTGKTFTAAALLSQIIKSIPAWDVAVCAPTGKAAVRLTESLARLNVSLEATTIHRCLRVSRGGHDGKGWGFQHNETSPLPYRVLVVDECSMIDADLMGHLLAACQQGTHILMLGDIGQLPPVGHGAPLRDFLDVAASTGFPTVGRLTEIRRNAGEGVIACHQIARGLPWRSSNGIDVINGRNLMHRHAGNPAESLRTLRGMLLQARSAGIDPVWDCQVLVTVNEKSELGRKSVNRMLQDLLNPLPPGIAEDQAKRPFRLNDKVICTSNTLLDLVPADDAGNPQEINSREFADDPENQSTPREFVANGEIGRVIHVEEKLCHVEIQAPRRTVVVPFSGKKSEARGDNEHAGAACDFDLGYAITVHKAQGSSARVVMFLVDDYPGARRVSSRELIFTAFSRFEELLVVIGQRRILDQDCRKVAISKRKTFLRELITEEVNRA